MKKKSVLIIIFSLLLTLAFPVRVEARDYDYVNAYTVWNYIVIDNFYFLGNESELLDYYLEHFVSPYYDVIKIAYCHNSTSLAVIESLNGFRIRFYDNIDSSERLFLDWLDENVSNIESFYTHFSYSEVPPVFIPTATPIPTYNPNPTAKPTNTPVPVATNTPVPNPTNTPVPVATNTPVPVATNTPVPVATNTPTPNPNERHTYYVSLYSDNSSPSVNVYNRTFQYYEVGKWYEYSLSSDYLRYSIVEDRGDYSYQCFIDGHTLKFYVPNADGSLQIWYKGFNSYTPTPTATLSPTPTPIIPNASGSSSGGSTAIFHLYNDADHSVFYGNFYINHFFSENYINYVFPSNFYLSSINPLSVNGISISNIVTGYGGSFRLIPNWSVQTVEFDVYGHYLPVPVATNTPVPTNIPVVSGAPALSPTPLPTYTPVPKPTNTPVPKPTNTPIPVATNTPIPLPTNTPVPLPPESTPIPTFNPNAPINPSFDYNLGQGVEFGQLSTLFSNVSELSYLFVTPFEFLVTNMWERWYILFLFPIVAIISAFIWERRN